MPVFQQFRMWISEAPTVERRGAAASLLVALAIVAWAAIPGADRDAGRDSAARAAFSEGADGTQSGSTSSGESRSGDTGEASDAGAPVSGPTPGRVGAAAATMTTAVNSSGGTDIEALTASDRGVTPGEINVGVAMLTLAGLHDAGWAINLRTDISEVVDAYVDHANKGGWGQLSRKLVPVKKRVDVLDAQQQQQRCLEFTRDDKVFAVLDIGTFSFPPGRACMAANETPLLTNTSGSGSAVEIEKGAPYLLSVAKDFNRRAKDWVFAAKDAGFFSPDRGFERLGILSDNCEPETIDHPSMGVKAYLREVGVTKWNDFRMDCSIADQQRQISQAATAFRLDGVTHVLPAVTSTPVQIFMQNAEAIGFRPKYFMSDVKSLTHDTAPSKFPRNQAQGMQAISNFNHGRVADNPAAVACSKILTDHGLAAIETYNKDIEALGLCDVFQVYVRSIGLAGPQPTRTAFSSAVRASGEYRLAQVGYSNFNNMAKFTGGDAVQLVHIDKDKCECWIPSGPFRPAYG